MFLEGFVLGRYVFLHGECLQGRELHTLWFPGSITTYVFVLLTLQGTSERITFIYYSVFYQEVSRLVDVSQN